MVEDFRAQLIRQWRMRRLWEAIAALRVAVDRAYADLAEALYHPTRGTRP